MCQTTIYLLWVKVEYTYYESNYNILIMSQTTIYLLWVKVEYTYYESNQV